MILPLLVNGHDYPAPSRRLPFATAHTCERPQSTAERDYARPLRGRIAKIAILVGSIVSASVGLLMLRVFAYTKAAA
jgi:hypothetical protein